MKFSYSLIKKLLPKVPPKARLIEALNLRSFETENLSGDAFEVSLPANRYSDAASHLGIARETSVIFGAKLKNPVKQIVNLPTDRGFLSVKIQEPALCRRYAARYFEIKKVGTSPAWIQKILKSCGLKPINSLVDLMNYVMLEVGQPLHVFDFDRLTAERNPNSRIHSNAPNKKIILIRLAKNGEKMETLDIQKIILDNQTLVIADSEKPIAIAGIKGGLDSGVTRKTRRIIVEAANFDGTNIYKTSRRIKLPTDAALRFSHGISPALVDWSLDRVTELLAKSGAKLLDSVDIYNNSVGDELIEFDLKNYSDLVGASVSLSDAQKIFRALGFYLKPNVGKTENNFLVRVPSWRTDIEGFEDLAEEVSRFSGYDKIRPQPIVAVLQSPTEEDLFIFKDRIRQSLVNFQLDEVYNYSFLKEDDLDRVNRIQLNRFTKSGLAELENPIAEDEKYLRPAILPMLLKNAESNSRFFDQIKIFEIGKIFSALGEIIQEKLSLGIVLAAKKEQKLIFELKGIIDELLKGLGVDDFSFVDKGNVIRIEIGPVVIGVIGPVMLEKQWNAAGAELDLDKVLNFTEEEKEFVPLKKFPAVVRDVSLLLSSKIKIGGVLSIIQDASPQLVQNVDLLDEYVDEKFGGKQSLTFRIIFQADDRTLTDEEVGKEMRKIILLLRKKTGGEIR